MKRLLSLLRFRLFGSYRKRVIMEELESRTHSKVQVYAIDPRPDIDIGEAFGISAERLEVIRKLLMDHFQTVQHATHSERIEKVSRHLNNPNELAYAVWSMCRFITLSNSPFGAVIDGIIKGMKGGMPGGGEM